MPGETLSLPQEKPWELESLMLTAQKKGVKVKEKDAFTTLRGATTTLGQTAIISLKSSMSDPEKMFVLAHELGHLALGHFNEPKVRRVSIMNLHQDRDQGIEREAHRWSASLLLPIEVINSIQWDQESEFELMDEIIARITEQVALSKPQRIIQEDHRDTTFRPSAEEWMRSPKQWYEGL